MFFLPFSSLSLGAFTLVDHDEKYIYFSLIGGSCFVCSLVEGAIHSLVCKYLAKSMKIAMDLLSKSSSSSSSSSSSKPKPTPLYTQIVAELTAKPYLCPIFGGATVRMNNHMFPIGNLLNRVTNACAYAINNDRTAGKEFMVDILLPAVKHLETNDPRGMLSMCVCR